MFAGPLEVPETNGGRAWFQAFDDDWELIEARLAYYFACCFLPLLTAIRCRRPFASTCCLAKARSAGVESRPTCHNTLPGLRRRAGLVKRGACLAWLHRWTTWMI